MCFFSPVGGWLRTVQCEQWWQSTSSTIYRRCLAQLPSSPPTSFRRTFSTTASLTKRAVSRQMWPALTFSSAWWSASDVWLALFMCWLMTFCYSRRRTSGPGTAFGCIMFSFSPLACCYGLPGNMILFINRCLLYYNKRTIGEFQSVLVGKIVIQQSKQKSKLLSEALTKTRKLSVKTDYSWNHPKITENESDYRGW